MKNKLYILIKEYPLSPKLGAIVSCGNANISSYCGLPMFVPEKYPEYWMPITKKRLQRVKQFKILQQ